MHRSQIPKINENSKLLIGLGDSFTQGTGSWSNETYNKFNGKIDIHRMPENLIPEMYQNSWVNQLCKYFLIDYTPVNLGKQGTGNRAAIKELYLYPEFGIENCKEVIVVYLLSGIERFDFINKDYPYENHFYTMWPNPWDKNSPKKELWKAYAEDVWSDKFSVVEAILNIKEAESYCRARGFKLIIASAFEQRYTQEYFLKYLGKENQSLIDSLPWQNFFYPNGYLSFMELLLDREGNRDMALGTFYNYYSQLQWPSRYITNCCHPSQEGHYVIAETLHKHILNLGWIG